MGKKSRVKAREAATESATGAAPGDAVGPRQPCPCGSGRRYKNCHGAAGGSPVVWTARPFEGLPNECDLIALREFVPAATAPLTLKGGDRTVVLASLLPGAAPALVKPSGTVWLGLQVQHGYGDPSRDLAAVLTAALETPVGDGPGEVVGLTSDPGDGPRLQDLVEGSFEVTVRDGFDYWAEEIDDTDGAMAAVIEQASAAASPTVRLAGVEAAYWTSMGDREFLRWVRPENEDALLDALARLHAAGKDDLVEGARLIGMFRAHGLLTPVWDLPVGTGAEALVEQVAAFDALLTETLADPVPLGTQERSARSGLASRQVTIR